jgi:preprotein translocase subunit SecF
MAMNRFARKRKAFVLLIAVGVLAVLGLVIWGLSTNVEFTYHYTRLKMGQRELSQALRAGAELIARDSRIREQVVRGKDVVALFELENPAHNKISVSAKAVPNAELKGFASSDASVSRVEAVTQNGSVTIRRVATCIIGPSSAIVVGERVVREGKAK